MLCFSQKGWETGKRIKEKLKYDCSLEGKSKYIANAISISHTQWTEEKWNDSEAIVFIGACGIAVRSIAPFVVSKKTDPAVLVVDECGRYVISLLSGHLGGANELTNEVALILGALPIVTTATDLNEKFAVDVFAKKHDCSIFPMNIAKEVSASLLAGKSVGFYSDFPVSGKLPEGVVSCNDEMSEIGIAVSIHKNKSPFKRTLHLVPKIVSLGMGCRKGKPFDAILKEAKSCLDQQGIYLEAVHHLASIDLKKEEQGLLELAKVWNIPFITFSEAELRNANGEFSSSEFVKQIAGVDNVCERSAVLASDQGYLIQKKHSEHGVTCALAVKDWRINFE